jgi:hypothetical protein
MAARRQQTLLQLTDELVELLDRRAEAEGISRSALVRLVLERELRDERAELVSARMVEGYMRHPQRSGEDAWGDLGAWSAANARRNLRALGAEESEHW